MPDRNIKITLQYDGSRYDGWQKQGNTDKTIQGKLEQILEKMAGQTVRYAAARLMDAMSSGSPRPYTYRRSNTFFFAAVSIR